MRIQYVSTYISMSKEGLVEKFLCPVDQSLLFSNQDIEENIFLYCLSCKYKKKYWFEYLQRYSKISRRAVKK